MQNQVEINRFFPINSWVTQAVNSKEGIKGLLLKTYELHVSHGTQCTNNPFPLKISFISNSPYCLPNHSFKVSLENSALDQLSNDPIVDIL